MEHDSVKILNRNTVILWFIILSIIFCNAISQLSTGVVHTIVQHNWRISYIVLTEHLFFFFRTIFTSLPTWRAGKGVQRRSLPGCICQGGPGSQNRTTGRPDTGNDQKLCLLLKTRLENNRIKIMIRSCLCSKNRTAEDRIQVMIKSCVRPKKKLRKIGFR